MESADRIHIVLEVLLYFKLNHKHVRFVLASDRFFQIQVKAHILLQIREQNIQKPGRNNGPLLETV